MQLNHRSNKHLPELHDNLFSKRTTPNKKNSPAAPETILNVDYVYD